MDNPRIEELRRRIQKDPASIAFAQLAEEHRRAGQHEEAIRVCRAGLAQHPAYLSARITLGRALLELRRFGEAATEFEYVLGAAPDNLTAIRELADIRQRHHSLVNRPEPVAPLAPAVVRLTHVEPAPIVEPVIVELEAWLSVLAQDRVVRPARV